VIRIRDIKLPVKHDDAAIIDETAKILCLDKIYPGNSYPDFSYEVLRKSIDARKKPDIYYVYTVRLLIDDINEKKITGFFETNGSKPRFKKSLDKIITDPVTEYVIPECGSEALLKKPVVVGAGPAGLFCALSLARRGFEPVIVERGGCVEDRSKSVEQFWKTGKLDPDSNVQFGEGGAGTFSDGKLNTLTKDINGRNTFVLHTFYEHGAPKDITVDAKPHIGTDILLDVVRNIRREIIDLGGTFMFDTLLTDIVYNDGKLEAVTVRDKNGNEQTIDTDICILCIGHSARDTFEMLYSKNIEMTQKSFAVGLRAAHPQSVVDKWAYGDVDRKAVGLPVSDYKVTNETSKGRRVFSFCMCPGGYVVNASSEDSRLCINGMSERKRDSKYANSAIICAVDPDDFIQDRVAHDHPLAGMYYQRSIEEAAFIRGNGSIPVQYFADYENDTKTKQDDDISDAVKGAYTFSNLRGILSSDIDEAIIESMHKFGYTRKGFDADDTLMLGVEARTSCPIRILRNDAYESNISGLYPCGEGAGYAGGIMSAATDGLAVAAAIIQRYHFEG